MIISNDRFMSGRLYFSSMPLNPPIIRKTLASAWLIPLIFLLSCLSPFRALAQTQQLLLQFNSGDCKIGFTLGDILHTVHGSFKLKRGEVGYDLATKLASGALVIDAPS